MMKRIIVFTLFSCLSVAMVVAQPHNGKHKDQRTPEMRKKMKAYQVAFITEELDLTAEEAQQFWPIFNEREQELRVLKKKRRQDKKNTDLSELTDAQIQVMINNHFDTKQRELDIERTYTSKFSEVLPLRKVVMLHRIEREFRHNILKEYRKRRE